MLVDPPEGWRYGFPKPWTFKPSYPNLPGEEYKIELRHWFTDNGYPATLIEQGMLEYLRFIGEEGEETLDIPPEIG